MVNAYRNFVKKNFHSVHVAGDSAAETIVKVAKMWRQSRSPKKCSTKRRRPAKRSCSPKKRSTRRRRPAKRSCSPKKRSTKRRTVRK